MSDTLQVSLLYGREHGLYLDDNESLKMDVKGFVFKNPWAGAFSTIDRDDADIAVVSMRRGKALRRARASVDRVACWLKCCAARSEIACTDTQSLAGRDEGAPAPP